MRHRTFGSIKLRDFFLLAQKRLDRKEALLLSLFVNSSVNKELCLDLQQLRFYTSKEGSKKVCIPLT
jgi:hypothetical protein